MRIDKYLYEMDHPKKPSHEYDYRFFLNEISYYDSISKDKQELIKSVGEYLSRGTFTNILDLYNNFKEPYEHTGYVQCNYTNGKRFLNPICLVHVVEYGTYCDEYGFRSLEEVSEDYNRYNKVGEQFFTKISIVGDISDTTTYDTLVYCSDGNVFLDRDSAANIAKEPIDLIGVRLAHALKERQASEERMINNINNPQLRKKGIRNLR